MAYQVEHRNKKTGVVYVYESISVWDKEKQQSRNKQVCIGKRDPVTGEIIPSRRLQPERQNVVATETDATDDSSVATATIVGPSIILDVMTDHLGLLPVLKSAFPDNHADILSLAYYLAAHGGPLCQSWTWLRTHQHPASGKLTSQRISELLATITTARKQAFFSRWMDKILDDDYLCYDITSVSSYSELNEYIRYGHNRDLEKLPQLNLAMLFGQESRLPAYYNRTPGNITDVQTIHNILETFKKLEVKTLHFILDKGFYSKKNIEEMLAQRHHFTISVPLHNHRVQKEIDAIYDTIQDPEHYRMIDDEALYVHSQLYPWGEQKRRCYLHLFYNDMIRSEAVNRFNLQLQQYKEELESGRLKAEHQEMYDHYFTITSTPVRGKQIAFKTEAVHNYIKRYAGFQALLTTKIKDPLKTLQVYRDKDVVEKSFDDLKNALDMKRLRMHGIETVDGRLFIQFIALLLLSILRREMRESKLITMYTVRELLLEMDPLTRIEYTGKYGKIMTEVTKSQRDILKLLEISLPELT